MKIEIDDKDVQKKLAELEPKQLRKITKAAFRSAAGVVKRQAQKNYKALFPGSMLYLNIAATPFKDGLGAFVRVPSRLSGKKAAKLNAKAGGNAYERAQVVLFLEGGTGPRKTEKGYRRGSLRSYGFLRDAASSHGEKALAKFNKAIQKKLEKLNK